MQGNAMVGLNISWETQYNDNNIERSVCFLVIFWFENMNFE